jgi:hypothetical protein
MHTDMQLSCYDSQRFRRQSRGDESLGNSCRHGPRYVPVCRNPHAMHVELQQPMQSDCTAFVLRSARQCVAICCHMVKAWSEFDVGCMPAANRHRRVGCSSLGGLTFLREAAPSGLGREGLVKGGWLKSCAKWCLVCVVCS